MQHLRTLRIIARLNVGGPARHVALLDAGLRARGHDTLLVYGALGEGEASLEQPALESGIPLLRQEHLGRSVRAGSDIRAFLALLRLIFARQPDVIHTHTAKAGTLGRLAALAYNLTRPRSRRALVVHTFHGHVFEGYFSPAVNRLVRLTERLLARLTDRIVTISPRQRDDIVGRFGVAPAARTEVVPLGLDLDVLLRLDAGEPGPRAFGADPDDIVVGYAGRMVPVKDLATLVEAFARAQRRVPALRLLLAGDGPERQQAEALVHAHGLAHRVSFAGWVHDLPRFYGAVDIFALSSLNEGTPVAVIEAMAAAKPVVATEVGGVPDVVEAGRSGLLVPARDPAAFADALVQLAGDAPARRTMGEAGRLLARARYSHRRLVDDVETMYVRALAGKRGTPAGTGAPPGPGA